MDTKQLSGYIVAAIGLLGILFSNEKIRSVLPIGIPEQIKNMPLLLISGGIFVIGIVLVLIYGKVGPSKKEEKEKEVPIYKGNEIVGYRRE